MDVNFEDGMHAITYSQVENFKLYMAASSFTLSPTGIPAGTGTKFYLIFVDLPGGEWFAGCVEQWRI